LFQLRPATPQAELKLCSVPKNSRVVPGTSTVTTRVLLRVVAEQAGPEGVSRVLERAGAVHRREELQSTGGRISYPDKLRLFEAAAAELDDPRIGLRLGPASLLDSELEPWRKLWAAGSPAAAFRGISRIATRYDSAIVYRCDQAEEGSAAVARKVLAPYQPNRIDCDYALGFLAQVPASFGLTQARVDHGDICQLNGAPECMYNVAWNIPPRQHLARTLRKLKPADPPTNRTSTAEHRLRLLEAAASDLVSNSPLDEVLDRILTRADSAVHAPGHLLAVRALAGDRHVRVRGIGKVLEAALDETEMVLSIDAAALADLPVLSVPVASESHFYGVMAAVAHPGQEFFPEDTDALASYARHAAVSLDIAGIIQEAREHGETAQLLLDVSRSLSKHSTEKDLATSIADAVPSLSDADRSAIALWDTEAGKLRIAGMSGWHGAQAEQLAAYMTTEQESPELAQLLATGTAILVDRNGSDWARGMLADFAISALAAIPIMAGNQVSGIVLAHWADEPAPDTLAGTLIERLSGLAALAAVALENIRLLEDARRQALRDPLTGLPNRAFLEDLLETSLVQASRTGQKVGLLFCDINRFKRINDWLGHGAGDSVLRHVGAQIKAALRDGDTVARYSGDEFVVLLPNIDTAEQADDVADQIRSRLAEPLDIDGKKIFVEVAIGTTVRETLRCDDSDSQQVLARQLVEEADFEMYRAKARTRGHALPTVHRRDYLQLESDLRGAAARGELRVQFQPQIDLATNKIVAAEALVRWQHPDLGLVSPGEFIPLAEDSNLIAEVGAFVLEEACTAGERWHTDGHGIEVAVNVSAFQLGSTGFPDLVRKVLQRTRFPAGALTLEVTESQAMSESAVSDDNLREFRSMGVGISIDDFGTGFSSLAQLHRLPVTEVKIDRSFITRLGEDGSAAFVAGIVGLGHGLGLRVIAEGVETSEQMNALRAMGCDRAQGFLFSKPVDASVFEGQLRAPTRS
jgi:diguanylate cyclase (GGDEF)-like protein